MADETTKKKTLRQALLELGVGVVLVVVVLGGSTIVSGIVLYILSVFNSTHTVSIPHDVNLLNPVIPLLQVVAVLIGIILIVAGAGQALMVLLDNFGISFSFGKE